MEDLLITSKNGSQFHPMVPVVLFLLCVPIAASGLYAVLIIFIALLVFTFSAKKLTKLNLKTRSCKDGWFDRWNKLPDDGYLSIFYETSQVLAQARSQQTVIKTKDLHINFIANRKKRLLYTAEDLNDAFSTAKRISEAWGVKVYDANKKTWIS